VPEWLNGAVSKTVNGGFVVRGFESLPLRYLRRELVYEVFAAARDFCHSALWARLVAW
jgi:hypothetical protein